jgi:hypothetical protein
VGIVLIDKLRAWTQARILEQDGPRHIATGGTNEPPQLQEHQPAHGNTPAAEVVARDPTRHDGATAIAPP